MDENKSAAEMVVAEVTFLEPPSEDDDSEPVAETNTAAAKPKPPRTCKICGHPSGNSVGKIKLGRLIEVEEGGLKLLAFEPVCDPCGGAMPDAERKKLRKIGFLYGFVSDQNREIREFAVAKAYWAAVIAGTAERMPEERKTPEGMLSCGVPECARCHGKSDHKVDHFVVITINGKLVLFGICAFQAAALAQCGVEAKNLFVSTNYGMVKRLYEEELTKFRAFEAAKEFWRKVADDEAKVEVRVEETERGDIYRCGVPGCKCREHGDRPVEYFVVLDGQKDAPIAGICKFQFAALKQSEVKLFAAGNGDGQGLGRCGKHRNWLLGQAKKAMEQARRGPRQAEPKAAHPTFMPAGPRVLPDQISRGDSKASEAARERQAAYAEALRSGEAIVPTGAVPEAAEASDGYDPVAAEVRAHNAAVDARCAGKRKSKGGKKDGDKGGRRKR